jgi:phage replication O-like protein O
MRTSYNFSKYGSFTQLPNSVLETLATARLSGRDFRVVMAILRCTFGYSRGETKISWNRLSKITGIDRRSLYRILRRLERWNIIVWKRGGVVKNDDTGVSENDDTPIGRIANRGNVSQVIGINNNTAIWGD